MPGSCGPCCSMRSPCLQWRHWRRKLAVSYLWWWLGLPRSLSSAALYGSSNSLHLPFSSLSEEFVVTRSREAMQYQDTKDSKVAAAGIEVHSGRKWSAARELQVVEGRLRQRALVGVMAAGQSGLGFFPSCQVGRARGKKCQHLLQEEVRAGI